MRFKMLFWLVIALVVMVVGQLASIFPEHSKLALQAVGQYISFGNMATAQQPQVPTPPTGTNPTNLTTEQKNLAAQQQAQQQAAQKTKNLGALDDQLKQFIGNDEATKKKREEDIERIFKGYQDYIDLAPTEIRLLYELTERRLKLDQREQNIKEQEATMESLQKRLNERNRVMEELNFELKKQLGLLDTSLEAERKKIRDLYANMKPDAAAAIWNTMDNDTLTLIVTGMPARVSGPIMGKMNPKKVLEITQAMAESNRKSLIDKLRKKEGENKSKAELDALARDLGVANLNTNPGGNAGPLKPIVPSIPTGNNAQPAGGNTQPKAGAN